MNIETEYVLKHRPLMRGWPTQVPNPPADVSGRYPRTGRDGVTTNREAFIRDGHWVVRWTHTST